MHLGPRGGEGVRAWPNGRIRIVASFQETTGRTRNLDSTVGFPGTGFTFRSSTLTIFDSVSRMFPLESERNSVRKVLHVDVLMWSRISKSRTVTNVRAASASCGRYWSISASTDINRNSMHDPRDLFRRLECLFPGIDLVFPEGCAGVGRRDCHEL